jgi:hypothetical protein
MLQQLINLIQDISLYGLEKIGLYYSVYRGFVADANDPQSYGRIKVSVPDVYGEHIPDTWAWPISNYSGQGYGLQVIPRRNDLVWVSFERGNPKKPLWAFGHFGKNEKPDDLKSIKKFWFRTPEGISIVIDDEAKTIELFDKAKEKEPMLLGNKTYEKLDKLLDTLLAAKVNTSLGPQPFLPTTLQELQDLKANLNEIKSTTLNLS